MGRMALPCIACGREIRNVFDDSTNQPSGGTAFESHGHYGSTAFDPMDGHYLEINVCDLCLVAHPERVLEGRDKAPVIEDGAIVGWEDRRYRLVPWRPSARTVAWVLRQARKEHA